MAKNKKLPIGAVSLFSGAGGLDVASFLAGVPVLSSTDFDDDCIETLKLNDLYGDTDIIKGDLHEISSDVFKSIVQKRNPEKFIVILNKNQMKKNRDLCRLFEGRMVL